MGMCPVYFQKESNINWKVVKKTMKLHLNTSGTTQVSLRDKFTRKAMKIILSGASDNVKIDSLFRLINDSRKESKMFSRFSDCLTQIKKALYNNQRNNGNKYFFRESLFLLPEKKSSTRLSNTR
jgi:hypothetical protein